MSSTRHQQLDEDEQTPPTVAEVAARTGNRSALQLMRKVRRGRLRLPITLSVVLMVLNVALMVFW
ncbi:MAG: histidine kinase, partial [Gimesia sp.]|nr:histidine kinase [Gimesia sp.]